MARPLRVQYPGALYHVMNRGLNRNAIFIDAEHDRYLFKKTVGEAVDQWRIRIHAFSLMDNHYHLLIETPLPNISRVMRHIDGVYTQRFNRRHGRDGPLLRGRFKSILVEKESYFLELVRYIHLNGVRAKRCPSPQTDLYSSHWDYLHPHQATSWLWQSVTLSYFGNSEPSAQDGLHRFVLQGIPEELEKILERKKWPTILGLKPFVDSIRETYLKSQNRNRDLPQKNSLLHTKALQPELVIRLMSEAYFVRQDTLSNSEENAVLREARWASIYFLRKYSFLKFNEIGMRLGGVSYKAVQQYLYRNDYSKTEKALVLEARLEKMSHVAT